jgi:ribosomal-protein-alanine N-acetyltransferase
MSRDLIESGLGWTWTGERVVRSIRNPESTVLSARLGPRVVGFAIMYFGMEFAHLNLIAVTPEQQGRCIGRSLLSWLEESALTAGISVVYLEVRAANRGAQQFYQRVGYQSVARLPRYYGGRETAIRMAHDLWCAAPTGPS